MMQDTVKIKEEEIEILDLTEHDEEYNKRDPDLNFPDKKLRSGEDDDELQSTIDVNESSPQKENSINESSVSNTLSISKSVRNFGKSLDKAIAEIKKGGSLVTVAYHYGIPEDVLYQKLVSRSLPQEMDILSQYEEDNLIKWIIKTNSQNLLVFKHELLEKVGKMKKVLKITPIFHKSKFGRMWYDYFLRKHPEIYENDGLLMPSQDEFIENSNTTSIEKSPEKGVQLKEEAPINKKKNLSELLAFYQIKKAVVVLEDFRKQNAALKLVEKELEFSELKQEETKPKIENTTVKVENPTIKIEEDLIEFDWLRSDDESAAESDDTWKIGKAVSYLTSPKSKKHGKKKKPLKKIKPTCEKCNLQFYDNAKLQRHVLKHIPKELYNIVCYKCLKRFPSKYHCKVHMKISHSSQYYPCPVCDKQFKHQTSLIKHKEDKHSDSKISSEPKRFICDICKKSYRYKNSLEDHITYGHLKEEGKHSCDICKKNFIKYSHMARHRMRHSKIKRFSCSHCPKTFSRKYLMRDHITKCFKRQQTQEKTISKNVEMDNVIKKQEIE